MATAYYGDSHLIGCFLRLTRKEVCDHEQTVGEHTTWTKVVR